MEITVGTEINGLTMLRELGRGGMGAVYLADDHKLGRQCAVKVLHPHLVSNEIARARFYTEVRAATAIDHPAVVKTYSVDELPGGALCCQMEYVDGPTLTEFCKQRREPLPARLILRIIGPICEAFDQLHALHIVHRDLKPDNVLIIDRGGHAYPRVLDFGIARRIDEPRLTRPGVVTGTMAYMSPEQLEGKAEIDHRSDIYSLGVLMYWMSTGGYLPYDVSDGALYWAQRTEPPVDPRRRSSGVSDLAASVMLTAIHSDPARRPRTMGALALMYARSIASDGIQPDGVAILRESAGGLLKIGNLDETLRGSLSTPRGLAAVWKYEYGPTLGRGGMAEVVRATQRGAGQFAAPRAVKLILPEFAAAPQFEEMFHSEARIAALLQHRNIVRVLDHDRDPMGRLYLAMEYIEGIDLWKLRSSGPIPHEVTIFVLCELLEALDYIHNLPPSSPLASPEEAAARGGARGLVHRDVSHDNVLISWDHEVKLSDFGIAKLRTGTWANGSVMLKGKPRYMSPEQASGAEKLDGRSDLWAVGVMLWELLTGYTLFERDHHTAVLKAVLLDPISSPSNVCPGVPPQLEAIAMRLLQRELTWRFQTAREVITALQSCDCAARDGRAELARLLAERFPDRARPRQASLPPLVAVPAAAVYPPQPSAVAGSSEFAASTPGSIAPLWQAPSTTGHALGQAMPLPARRVHRWPWLAALGVVIAVASGWTLVHHADPPRGTEAAQTMQPPTPPGSAASAPTPPMAPLPAPAVAASSAIPPAPPTAPAASPAPAPIPATIATTPPGATLRIDGLGTTGSVGRSPLTVSVMPGTRLRVRADLAGFQSATQTATLDDEHRDIQLTLEPAPAAKTVRRSAPSAAPTPKPARPARTLDDPGIIE